MSGLCARKGGNGDGLGGGADIGRVDWSKGAGLADGRGGGIRGQYSDAVLSELESQNDEELEGMGAKVKMLKDVSDALPSPSAWTTWHDRDIDAGVVSM